MTRVLRHALCIAALALAHPALAHTRHHVAHHRHWHHRVWHHRPIHHRRRHERRVVFHRACSGSGNVARARCMGLPWCGAYLSDYFGIHGRLGRMLWVARNWAVLFGHRVFGPALHVVVVWPHHVGLIVGRQNGRWIVLSGNDGHQVRERARSLRGAIAFRGQS
ncbi:MAG: hypothetical protein ACREHV_11600 [Rhizomicrobium sp.]